MAISTTKAVSSAKLVKDAKKSGAIDNLPHAGTIMLAEQEKKGTGKNSANGIQTTFAAKSDWNYDLNAGLLADALSTGLLVYYRDTIMMGEKPDGSGAQKPLSPKTLKSSNASKGRKSKVRGFKTGYFADNIRRGKISGTTVKAQTKILPPTNRNVFIAEEAKRGNAYFSIQGTAAIVIEDITSKFVELGMEGQNRPPNLNPIGPIP